MISNVIDEEGQPIELAPGGGDLRFSGQPLYEYQGGVRLIDRQVSFARLYSEQPMIASTAGWLLRQSHRVPLKLYRRTGEDSRERLRPGDHPLAAALLEPWDRGSQADLVHALLGPVLIHGNSLTVVEQGASDAIEFRPADWRYVKAKRMFREPIVAWELDRDDPATEYQRPVDQVLHCRTYSPLGPFGISPLQQLGITLAIEDAAARYQRSLLRNGALPRSAIKASTEFLTELSEKQQEELMDNLRDDIDVMFAGPPNAGRPALLPPGLEWDAVGHTAVEAELIQQRTVARQEAVGVYGLTLGALGIVERSSELNEQRQMAYTDGLAPALLLCEAALNAQVIASLLQEPDLYAEFDFAGILRGDKLKEVQALQGQIASAMLTPNEARAVLNLPRSSEDGMDSFYLPRNNLIPLGLPYSPSGNTAGDHPGTEGEGEPAGGQQDEQEQAVAAALNGNGRDPVHV